MFIGIGINIYEGAGGGSTPIIISKDVTWGNTTLVGWGDGTLTTWSA